MRSPPIDVLADVHQLRAFVDVVARKLGRSDLAILEAVVNATESEQRLRADDPDETFRIGRVRQVAADEIIRLHSQR